jgi:CheY-like chemotaxis protein
LSDYTGVSDRQEGCVLVVEDEAEIRTVLQMVLEDEGCRVRTASNGAEALAILDGCQPELILLDMRMPVLDGWGFAAAYRRYPEPRVPVVVMTAARVARQWCREIDADDYVPKPFELDELFGVLSQYTSCVQP